MNYTEMEAKVREATNNEPWGASSTLMQEIADGTNSYSEFHEIMPMIYKRFTEKSADEWRQIYKALQLLEFLVKNGSERVVDYARSHLAVIDMLKHFHYHDQTGQDQGINIRNRAKELTALLGDVEKIRAERKKARSNKTKYGGMGNESAGGFGGSGKKYGGFGSDSLSFGGGYSSQVFGDGGGFNGSNYDGPGYFHHDDDDDFDEYAVEGALGGSSPPSSSSKTAPPPPKKQEPFADFISFDDEPSSGVNTTVAANDDDEFDDFQSATPAPAPTAAPAPIAKTTAASLAELFSAAPVSTSAVPLPTIPSTTSQFAAQKSNAPLPTLPTQPSRTTSISSQTSQPATTAKPAAKDDAFGSLWTSSKPKKPTQTGSLASLAQQNAKNSIWGATSNGTSNGSNGSAQSTLPSDSLI